MPPRFLLASLRSVSKLPEKNICPSCQFSNLLSQHRPRNQAVSRPLLSRRRHASTLSSTTAVNATKDIPAELKELHTALSYLQKEAPNYVNIGRLQLALRSLESQHPVVRIAGAFTLILKAPFFILADLFLLQSLVSNTVVLLDGSHGCCSQMSWVMKVGGSDSLKASERRMRGVSS